MTKDQARNKAMDHVFLHMTRYDVDDACKERGIRISKNRSSMEWKLIEALSYEWADEL